MAGGGFYTADEESGKTADDSRYSELIYNVYTVSVLSGVDGKDWGSVNYLRGLIYNPGDARDNADPTCLKLTEISASCKYVATTDLLIPPR